MIKKISIIFVLFFTLMPVVSFAGPRPGYGLPVCVYQSSLGPKIESYSKQWNTKEELKQVYNELMKNFVSAEIQKLKVIYLYPDIEEGVQGYYDADVVMKNDGNYYFGDNSYIVILGCDDKSTIGYISPILTHEYGHHFTTYYLVTKEQKYGRQILTSEYARVRGLNRYAEVKNNNSINAEYKWDVSEILAEDYVSLFGSASSKMSVEYDDSKERIEKGYTSLGYRYAGYNAEPQDNLDIPLATEVPGLYEYFKKLVGGATKVPAKNVNTYVSVVDKYKVTDNYKGFYIRWNALPGSYEYTVIMHPEGNSDYIIPIKTVKSYETLDARIGSYKKEGASRNESLLDYYSGVYVVRVFAKDSLGFVYEAGRCTVNFSENITKYLYPDEMLVFKDVPLNHWAYQYIIYLNQKGIINGYDGKIYKPEGTITRKEFLAILMRGSNIDLRRYKKISLDWFTREGYLEAAKKYGIITTFDYGKDYEGFWLDYPITREEITFMIGRVLMINNYTVSINSKSNVAFKDSINPKYKLETNLVVNHNIINGYPDQTFRGKNYATRSEVAKIMYKAFKVLERN